MNNFTIAVPADADQRFSPESAASLVGQVVVMDVDGRPVGRYVVVTAEVSDDGKTIAMSLSAKTR